MDDRKPAFEFTHDGFLFKVFDDGAWSIGASPYGPGAMVVINRIPALIAQAARGMISQAAKEAQHDHA